jgi:hypothetical protein
MVFRDTCRGEADETEALGDGAGYATPQKIQQQNASREIGFAPRLMFRCIVNDRVAPFPAVAGLAAGAQAATGGTTTAKCAR